MSDFSQTELNSVAWPFFLADDYCLIRKTWEGDVPTDRQSCHPVRSVEREVSKAWTKADPQWGGQETQTGPLLTFLELWEEIWHEVAVGWLVTRYLIDNQEEWNYTACSGCVCEASWEWINWKIRRVWKETGALWRLWWGRNKGIFFVYLCLFCLLNGSLGGLIGITARTISRPKKGSTYLYERYGNWRVAEPIVLTALSNQAKKKGYRGNLTSQMCWMPSHMLIQVCIYLAARSFATSCLTQAHW